MVSIDMVVVTMVAAVTMDTNRAKLLQGNYDDFKVVNYHHNVLATKTQTHYILLFRISKQNFY